MPEPTTPQQTGFYTVAHTSLLMQLRPYRLPETSSFFSLIDNRSYNQALHHLCMDSRETANTLLDILLKFKGTLLINLDEQIGEEHQSALHHVAIKQNRRGYCLLTQAGANTELRDAQGAMAIDYLLFEPFPGYQRR